MLHFSPMKFSRFECDEMTRCLHQDRSWARTVVVVVVMFNCFLSDAH